MFVGASNFPITLVVNVEFQELLCAFDPRYQVSGRFKITKELDMAIFQFEERSSLNSVERISLCADIWSKQGMTCLVFRFDCPQKDKCNITIAVCRFKSPHTAE